mgnify:CR=1 FL=1
MLAAKLPLVQVTVAPETDVAWDWIEGQAVQPAGRFKTFVVQLAAVAFTPKLLAPCVPLPGKVT